MGIYDKYIIPLGARLNPSLKGLILALLPGIEEEGNEHFDTVVLKLDKLSSIHGQVHFYHCLAQNMINVSHLRGAALHYLLRRLPKFGDGLGMILVGFFVMVY